MTKIFKNMAPYWYMIVAIVLLLIVQAFGDLSLPQYTSDIIDVGIAASDIHYIMVKGVEMAGCALLSLITGLLYAKYAAIAANGFAYELREREFSKIQEYSFANLDHFETSSLITRMTSDVTVMQNLISAGLRPLVRGPVMLVLGLLMAFLINAKLALVFVVCAPVLALILTGIVRKIAPMYGQLQKAVDQVAEALGDEGRILVRESGTEPLIRVMVEAGTDELCHENVDRVVKVMEAEGLVID